MRIASLILSAACGAFAQSTPAPPAFEIASIKPSPPYTGGAVYVGARNDPGRVSYSRVPMKYAIRTAYGFTSNTKIESGPGWLDSDMYDVVATFPAGTPNDRVLAMLQTLLAERCKLVVHRETREQPVYGLAVAKSGPKLKPYDPANRGNGNRRGPGHLELHNITLAQLADNLYSDAGRQVVDMSGLAGTYDVVLDWTDGASIFTAIEEQLGMKLETRRAPIEYLVIDHVEKPTEN
jgi:uncharacterized protein (TIGR03435 family)